MATVSPYLIFLCGYVAGGAAGILLMSWIAYLRCVEREEANDPGYPDH